jgi:sporulation protein YlmC with PRC-barrel domain
MLRTVNDLQGYAILATDGGIGEVTDLFFDDEDWVIRYLVVDTGTWLAGRRVLISPVAIGHPDWMAQQLPVSITKDQVKHSPGFDTQKPVSRQHETEYLGYYGYPLYWGGAGLWGMGAYPGGITTEHAVQREMQARWRAESSPHNADDSHLRSSTAVTGYHIHATDGEIGHVENMLLDDRTWAIRYLVVNTSNWWGGHHVLVAPQWIQRVSWSDATVSVDLTRQAVRDAPPYDSAAQLDRQQEAAIYEHYGRSGYWTTAAIREPAADRR